MRLKSVFLSTLVLSALFVAKAQAGILIEPYLGYGMASSNFTLGDGAASYTGQSIKLDGSGLGYGLRLGYSLPLVFFALDYSMANISNSVKDQPSGLTVTAENATVSSLGATAGINLLLVRPYVGYIFDDQVKGSSSSVYGTGFKLGLGFGFIPFVKLNLEYVSKTQTKSKDSAGVETTFGQSAFYKSGTVSGYFLNVSVPFSF